MEALTEPGSPDSISRVINKGRVLQVGVNENNHKYFGFLARGTKKMKARPYVLLGAEQVAPAQLNNRVTLWKGMILDFIEQKIGDLNGGQV